MLFFSFLLYWFFSLCSWCWYGLDNVMWWLSELCIVCRIDRLDGVLLSENFVCILCIFVILVRLCLVRLGNVMFLKKKLRKFLCESVKMKLFLFLFELLVCEFELLLFCCGWLKLLLWMNFLLFGWMFFWCLFELWWNMGLEMFLIGMDICLFCLMFMILWFVIVLVIVWWIWFW